MRKNTGQVVILLLLIMVVALAIGLSTIGRSILEVSTSRKSEDSSRAFSAAEAGIEKAIKQNENRLGSGDGSVPVALTNQTRTTAIGVGLPLSTNALGFYSRTKSDFAQFWLANPNNITCEGATPGCYTGSSFDLYFGDPNPKIGYFSSALPESDPLNPINDQPAIEVNIIYWDGSKYQVIKKYYDSKKDLDGLPAPRIGPNAPCDSSYPAPIPTPIPTNNNSTNYYCKITVFFAPDFTNSATTFPIMVRVRFLYTNIAHPIALQPTANMGFPKQANLYNSSGTSGDVQRTLEVIAYKSIMPQLFDYAVFSAADFVK